MGGLAGHIPAPLQADGLPAEHDAKDAQRHGWAVFHGWALIGREYSRVFSSLLAKTVQRSQLRLGEVGVEILGLTYLGYQVFGR